MKRYNVHVEIDGEKSGTFYLNITGQSESNVTKSAEWYAEQLFPEHEAQVYYIHEVAGSDPHPKDFTLEFEED